MTIFPEFEQELVKLARRSAATARGGRRTRRERQTASSGKVASFAPVIGAALVAIAVAAIALTMTNHANHTPPPAASGLNPARVMSYVQAADAKASKSPACRSRRLPAISEGSPSAAFLTALGVLRRPSTPADHPHHDVLASGVRAIYIRYQRLAQANHGLSYYIVPVGSISPSTPISARCYEAMAAALRAELPRIPTGMRAAAVALQARQRRVLEQLIAPGICLTATNPYVTDDVCATSATEIEHQGMITNYGLLSGVVPDGVAMVTIHYRATNIRPALTLTKRVLGNVFATTIRISTRGNKQPDLIWRSADGRVLRTVPGATRQSNGGGCGGGHAKPGMPRPCD